MSYIRIRKHYVHIPHLILGLAEFGLHFCAILCVDSLSAGVEPGLLVKTQKWLYLYYATILSATTLAMGVFSALLLESFVNMILRTLVSYFLLGSLSLSLLGHFIAPLRIPQDVFFWAIIVSMVVTVLLRLGFNAVFDAQKLRRKVLIFGTGKKASEILDAITKGQFPDIDVLGCVAVGNKNVHVREDMLIPEPENWQAFIKKNSISEVVFAQDERRRNEGGGCPLNDFLFAKLHGVDVTEVVSFVERGQNKLELPLLDTSWMLFSDGFRASKSRDCIKRIFDLLVSCILLVIALPLMIPTAIAVFIESGRPILYHQDRVGLNGKAFRIYKFRSMRQDAEKGGKAIWASKNDSRVTKVGAFIRNTRLDELPQLINVIRGEMSFVGPRPERPEFVEELKRKIDYYDVRHTVKPGLMGWAQLKYPYGASEEDAKNKLEYDLYYTKNHSLLMDVLIMIQTVEVILLGKGVH